METYKHQTKDTPWASPGRETALSRAGLSLVAVGNLPYEPAKTPKPGDPLPHIGSEDPEFEKYLMDIIGTAIQVGEGKLATCAHVVQAVIEGKKRGYLLARTLVKGALICTAWPFEKVLRYIDPRMEKVNLDVDLAVITVAYPDYPPHYDVPVIRWGNSTKLGVGDQVVIGGYPYGTDMFRITETNRGVIQPTFYPGIISAIIPATNPTETRLLQISAAAAGGISGGAVLDPKSGKLLGMVTSGLTSKDGSLHPVTYAIPSEVIAPYASSLSFDAAGHRVGKELPIKADGRPLRKKK